MTVYAATVRRNAMRARLRRDEFCSRRQAAALTDAEVESAHMGLRKKWPVAGRRRRHDRLNGTARTLCGRSAFAVQLARSGARYPLDRSNCATCANVSIANMSKAFAKIWTQHEAGAAIPSDFDLRVEGTRNQR